MKQPSFGTRPRTSPDHPALPALALVLLWGAAGMPTATAAPAPTDSTELSGEGTQFPDMTIEGEDRIRIEFERPPLDLDLDAKSAPGLERDRTLEIVERGAPDGRTPLLAMSAVERTPCLGRPWLNRFSAGPVVRLTPAFTGVERWTLSIADSRGTTVARSSGEGKVPKELSWDGRTIAGEQALPGLVYTYVFEAHDKAGNKRTFLGEGFTPGPTRRQAPGKLELWVSGREAAGGGPGETSPFLLEMASWVNQMEATDAPVVVEARARTLDEAQALASRVEAGLIGSLIGPPSRLQVRAVPESDAPETGVCAVRVGK